MAVTYGFYNSLNNDRVYDARQMSSIFDGIINDGIYMSIGERLMVSPSDNMQIIVGTGRAWFYHTWTLNDSRLVLTVEPSDLLYNRIDTVVLEINEELRENTIMIIKGTPAGSPSAPTLINTGTVHQIPLADIRVNRAVNSISSTDITNLVGSGQAPFVTGIIQTINADFLISRWNNEWSSWKGNFEAWVLSQKDMFNDWFNNLQTDTDSEWSSFKGDFQAWVSSQQSMFNDWFNDLQVDLDGDIAANHERRILALEAGGSTKIETVLEANLWENGEYSFEIRFPASQYDLQVDLNGDIATATEAREYAAAHLLGSINENKIFSFGNIPRINIPVVLTVSLRDETYRADVISAANWVDNKYSFESDYPILQYDISIEPDGKRVNENIIKAWNKALIFGQITENKAIAYGTVPTIDIPIIVKVVKK